MTTGRITYNLESRLPDGHRLFRVGTSEQYALADDSGRTPATTDDGVLLLDFDRPLEVDRNVFENKEYMHIPLYDLHGTRSTTITNAATLILLAARFEWDVHVDGVSYRVATA